MNLKIRFELHEVAAKTGVEAELILRFASLTWITPMDPVNNIFDAEDIARIQLIHDLQNNLGINDEAVPVILHLVDQINLLHRQLKSEA
jgi:chaperone modulatory protein CbpM